MTLLNPSFLWLMIPLLLLLWRAKLQFTQRIHLIVLMLLVLTLSRPVEEQALQEASIKAKDILIALDVSYSMKATDISPTRYDFAKETISALLEENPGDEPGSYIHPVIGVQEFVYSEAQLIDFLEEKFIVHKVYTSHKHISRGKAWKRRTISVYAEKDPYGAYCDA